MVTVSLSFNKSNTIDQTNLSEVRILKSTLSTESLLGVHVEKLGKELEGSSVLLQLVFVHVSDQAVIDGQVISMLNTVKHVTLLEGGHEKS